MAQRELFDQLAERHVSRFGINLAVQRGAIAAYDTKQDWMPGLLEANRKNQAIVKRCVEGFEGYEDHRRTLERQLSRRRCHQ